MSTRKTNRVHLVTLVDMKKHGKIFYFDWISFVLMLALLLLGLTFVLSATYSFEQPIAPLFKKQCLGVVLGIIVYIGCMVIDVRHSINIGYTLYWVVLALLAYTLLGGFVGMGGQRWISLYFFRVQPSELVKLLMPLAFVYHAAHQTSINPYKAIEPTYTPFMLPFITLVISFVLIAKQPDLGTALAVLGSGLIMLWLLGMPKKFFMVMGTIFICTSPICWKLLRPYQQKRILVILGYGDNHKDRYQAEQAKIAIGSGGLWGKGFLQGTQNKLKFLPEQHTDFIFSVICEEWGLCGALLIMGLFFMFFWRLFSMIVVLDDFFMQALGIGLLMPIVIGCVINVGMVLGLLPIVGVSLPFFSYGLSNLLVTLASLGMIQNIIFSRVTYGYRISQ